MILIVFQVYVNFLTMLPRHGSILIVCSQRDWNYYCFQGLRTNNGLEGWHHRLNSNIGTTNPNLYLVLQELKNDYIFNMATLAQVKHQENKQRRKKKYLLRHRRIINLMDRYANGSLTLDEYFIKISKTIGKRNASSDININSAENLP